MTLGAAYLIVVFVVLALGVIAISLPVTPKRICHMCESRVPITRRRCGRCGYAFTEQVLRQR